MKKIKKVLMSFGLFFSGLTLKVSATEPKYGVANDLILEPTIEEKIASIGKYVIPIILFIIGLFVILSKKITKKVKAIVISCLIILAILGIFLMNHLSIYDYLYL